VQAAHPIAQERQVGGKGCGTKAFVEMGDDEIHACVFHGKNGFV
jgi:hypothetical protein